MSLRCPVCLDQYNSSSRAPHALLCGHAVCAQCTTRLLQAQPILKCPECQLFTHSKPAKCVPLIDALRHLKILADDDIPPPEHDPWASPPNHDYELDKTVLHHAVQLLLDEQSDLHRTLQRFSGDENKLFHLKCEHDNLTEVIDSTIDALCTTTTKYVNVRDHITQLVLRIEYAQPGPGTFIARPRLPLRKRQRLLRLLAYLYRRRPKSMAFGRTTRTTTRSRLRLLRPLRHGRHVSSTTSRFDSNTTTLAPDDCHHHLHCRYHYDDEPRRHHCCPYDNGYEYYRYNNRGRRAT
ncbi:hypothetical protein AAVH_26085 [Aphelenchoides avenae]|nr:hypothetical protein AAVH_26085 [Aphelenchus avenae]